MIDWNFPVNEDGEDDGLNNSGIESFRNTPLNSLAREICQNSLDAKEQNAMAPVEVHFQKISLSKDDFPGHAEFRKTLLACKKYGEDSAETKKFFDKALEIIDQDEIPCLLISDYRTTGLQGVGEKKGSDWYKLTKAVGSSDKAGGLGSFGIGKFAPFANSKLRTVFYSTHNLSGEYAFQGIARLITHERGTKKTRGTGYYGVTTHNTPITARASIPKYISRNETGTNILIAGFPDLDAWEQEITRAVVDNFFYAVMKEKLIVKAGGNLINHANLAGIVEQIRAENEGSYTAAYFEALNSSDAREFIEEDFKGLGRISLKILVSKNFQKRVAMIRGSGMKIFDKGNFLTPLRFAGVFNAEGEKINNFLKALEPPQHDVFKAERADDPKAAKKTLEALYAWIREKVRSIAEQEIAEEIDIEGISKYLPDDIDEKYSKSAPSEDAEKVEAAEDIPIIIKQKSSYQELVRGPAAAADFGSDEGDSWDQESENEDENDDEGGKSDSSQTDSGSDGAESSAGGDETIGRNYAAINLQAPRVFISDPSGGTYIVNFIPEISGKSFIALSAIGEVGQEPVEITQARRVGSDEKIPSPATGKIGPIDLVAGEKYSLEVKLKNSTRFALGVSAHAN